MGEVYDLTKMLEEIIQDEKISIPRKKKISQAEIKKMLFEKRRTREQDKDALVSRIGDALLKDGLITNEQLKEALRIQGRDGGKLGSILVELNYITADKLMEYQSKKFGTPSVNLSQTNISDALMTLLPGKIMLQHRVLPIQEDQRSITLAMENPKDFAAIQKVEFLTGKRVIPVIAPEYQMQAVISCIDEKTGKVFSCNEFQQALRGPMGIQALLEHLTSAKGSDLMLTSGSPPYIRKRDGLMRTEMPTLTPEQCVAYAKALMSERQWETFLCNKELDFSITDEHHGRFRINAYRQKNTISLAIRTISKNVPTMESLGLPDWLASFALKPKGFIVIASPPSQGKTSSLAAFVEVINRNRECNVITLEDPIEFVHTSQKSVVNQREIGTDCDSYEKGLRSIFRQSPEVIVVSDMCDRETTETALSAALNGNLVLTTVRAPNCQSAIESLVDNFPEDMKETIRQRFADTLLLVFAQRLVPAKGNHASVLIYEKIINSPRIKELIRENKLHHIAALDQTEFDDFTAMDDSLLDHFRKGEIALEDALQYADRSDHVMQMIT